MSEEMEDVAIDANSDEGVSRPSSLAEFNGQGAAKDNLQAFLDSARQRQRHLDHTLFFGPPGLGKTTLAQIVAGELGVGFRQVGAPAIERTSDLVALLGTLDERDVVFIDEIHRLPIKIEEMLYIAMEDFRMDLIVGEGAEARALPLPLPKYTLIGATTNPGKLSKPLRDRFGIQIRLEPYTDEEMEIVLMRAAPQLGLSLVKGAAMEVGRRARGTPRIGLRLLNRIRDFAVTSGGPVVDLDAARAYLRRLGIDSDGLDDTDRRYLTLMRKQYRNRAVGVKTLAAALNESIENLEESVEPYLIRKGYIEKTPTGRRLVEETFPGSGNGLKQGEFLF
ncbi:Holliday junction branch migration DNA helicase RuvB [Rhizobium laguerreae]|uniref:Holliday junction branch migration DNA helicase RuvB n=1 Tax=Rhizobium laguerreae TaxID=1076926 RepID=UPI001C91740D|nr:Holliday junction branch migration DNA helicase RuvB [Rhizobium laguerreae]MBY3151286.1 Holliday junction branch migration DNA helicase RuvB [Rhizobium laguerreae]